MHMRVCMSVCMCVCVCMYVCMYGCVCVWGGEGGGKSIETSLMENVTKGMDFPTVNLCIYVRACVCMWW